MRDENSCCARIKRTGAQLFIRAGQAGRALESRAVRSAREPTQLAADAECKVSANILCCRRIPSAPLRTSGAAAMAMPPAPQSESADLRARPRRSGGHSNSRSSSESHLSESTSGRAGERPEPQGVPLQERWDCSAAPRCSASFRRSDRTSAECKPCLSGSTKRSCGAFWPGSASSSPVTPRLSRRSCTTRGPPSPPREERPSRQIPSPTRAKRSPFWPIDERLPNDSGIEEREARGLRPESPRRSGRCARR